MIVDPRSSTRCKTCKMHVGLCICEIIPQIDLATRVTLVIHAREIPKPTNTGELAARCLRNSDVIVRGAPGVDVDQSRLTKSEYENLVLFPDPDAKVLGHEYLEALSKPVNLIVPDGNWKQATRIPKREPALKNLPRVILPLGDPSEYRLRREPRKPHGLATMEAVARALAILEGPTVSEELMHVFRVMVERTLFTKGKLRLEEVYGGYEVP